MLVKDRICLSADIPDMNRVQAIARDFRACTTSIKIGPALMVSEGPCAIRALSELGMTDIIIDARLFGHANEIWAVVIEAARLPCVKAITVQSIIGPQALGVAVEAAQASVPLTGRIDPPHIVAVVLPTLAGLLTIDEQADCQRSEYVARCVAMCTEVGVHGLLLAPVDIPAARAANKALPRLVTAQRLPLDYRQGLPPGVQKKSGAAELVKAGAMHAFIDMSLITEGADIDWIADLLMKEVRELEPKETARGRVRRLLDQARGDSKR